MPGTVPGKRRAAEGQRLDELALAAVKAGARTAAEVAARIDRTRSAVCTALTDMVDEGRLYRAGRGSIVVYAPTQLEAIEAYGAERERRSA